MRFSELWAGLLYVFDIVTVSPTSRGYPPQLPLPDVPGGEVIAPDGATTHNAQPPPEAEYLHAPRKGPIFRPPNSPSNQKSVRFPGADLKCDYSKMLGYVDCSKGRDRRSRECWIRNPETEEEYNIKTNYETKVPEGVVREYKIDLFEQPLNLDGVTMEHGKVFNRVYPGPWITACWGDWIKVTVTNRLTYNGTSVHWHGIRMLNEMQMDGVNGVTQCPLAPGDSQTYIFRARQYGTTWYHSHYSLQYGDGAAGPITIFGPASAQYDEAVNPLIVTDWNHRSVFEDWPRLIDEFDAPAMTNMLFNGKGKYGIIDPDEEYKRYELTVKPETKYLLTILNTAVDTTFIFSIDDHRFKVIEADLVPIEPYETNAVVVGIGQRYHIVLETKEKPRRDGTGKFWMRAVPAKECSKFPENENPDEQVGILRYDGEPEFRTGDPVTMRGNFETDCRDEPFNELKPKHIWKVRDHFENRNLQEFEIGYTKTDDGPYHPERKNRWFMSLYKRPEFPLQIDFSNPTVFANDLDSDQSPWLNVVTENHYEEAWIWLLIRGFRDQEHIPEHDRIRHFIPAAHPMHLHGHDFAILHQSSTPYDRATFGDITCANNGKIKCVNPPRRDVALLPANGFLVIAFKADNPGTWLLHCHIAFHASSGLGMQIVENRRLIEGIIVKDKDEMERVCNNWKKWRDDPLNIWDPNNPGGFQDDSGI